MSTGPETPEEKAFRETIGMPLEKVITLYQRATENDWRTVQTTTQQVFAKFAASRTTAAEAAVMANLARSILKSENGHHLLVAGLADAE